MQDRARAPPERVLRRALIRIFGRAEDFPFTLDSWSPVAAGSVAVVLAGRLSDGTPVAIKLVRPSVERRIEADLQCLRWLLGRAERHPRFRCVPLGAILDDLAPLIERQCDMVVEAISARRVQAAAGSAIVVPTPLPLTRRGALVMEWKPIAHKLTSETAPLIARRRACRLLLQALYRMIFVHGFVHCDAHPGNVGLAADGAVILHDHGLVAELTDRDRRSFAALFAAVAGDDPAGAAREILASAAHLPAVLDRDAFTSGVAAILERWSGKAVGEFLIGAFVMDLFRLQHDHGVVGSPGYAAAIWALAACEGPLRQLQPDLDFQAEARPFFLSSLLSDLRLSVAS